MNDLLGGLVGGRYRLLEPLGKGGMGIVYAAIQEGLGRRVAIKILDARLSEDREQLERFRREAEVVAALGHPNIVQVTDFQYPEKDGDQPFLVMELLRGESLGWLLEREHVITAQRAAFIGSQALSALTAAHRAGVVHRDIKPDNIFVLSDAAVPDTVKVLDFGIAKLNTLAGDVKLTGTGAMLGTPAFMAPEQARGESDVDGRADLYALGATLYQALSGRLPHEAPSIPALLFAIVEKSPPPLRELRPDLPLELAQVIERAMAKDRAARFPDADAMRRALAPWSGLPASIPPPTSGTAATIAISSSGSRDLAATPIVVHHTPAPARAASTDPPTAKPTSVATRVMLFITALFAIGGITTVAILKIVLGAHTSASTDAPTPIPAVSISIPAIANAPSAAIVINTPTALAPVEVHAPVVALPSAVAPSLPRYGGTHGRFSSSDYSNCKGCEWEAFNTELRNHETEISNCFAASVHEPPRHETPYYEVSVNSAGAITSFHATNAADAAPKLDQCLRGVVASLPLKNKGDAGTFRISFFSECTPGMVNRPGSCN